METRWCWGKEPTEWCTLDGMLAIKCASLSKRSQRRTACMNLFFQCFHFSSGMHNLSYVSYQFSCKFVLIELSWITKNQIDKI